MRYIIEIKTSQTSGGGTNANVYMTLHGVHGDTEQFNARDHSNQKNAFESGQTDRVQVDLEDVGAIEAITVELTKGSASSAWMPEWFKITHTKTEVVTTIKHASGFLDTGGRKTVRAEDLPPALIQESSEEKHIEWEGETESQIYDNRRGTNVCHWEHTFEKAVSFGQVFEEATVKEVSAGGSVMGSANFIFGKISATAQAAFRNAYESRYSSTYSVTVVTSDKVSYDIEPGQRLKFTPLWGKTVQPGTSSYLNLQMEADPVVSYQFKGMKVDPA